MKYVQPYGITDPEAGYINGNPSTGTAGSIPPAHSIEHPQREIVNVIKDSDLTPDEFDLHQLAKSIQTGRVNYALDTGSKNLLSIALTPAITEYIDGMRVYVRVGIDNDGPAVISINGLTGKNIVRRGGGILEAGDLRGEYVALIIYNEGHNNFELYGASFAAGGGGGVPILGANSNLYVNGTTGSDTLYDGTTPTVAAPHGPFKTIQRAMVETFKYGPSVYTMTINVAAGTYPERVYTPGVIGPTTVISGAGKTSTFVTGVNNDHTFTSRNANQLWITNLCASTGTGTGPPCCFASIGGATLNTNECANGYTYGYVFSAYAGYIYIQNHTFNSGVNCMEVYAAFFGGFIGFGANGVHTFLGPMNVSAGVAVAASNGSIAVGMVGYQTIFINPGYVTGTKFYCDMNGIINTQGQGLNYFPGNVAGVEQRGGRYA